MTSPTVGHDWFSLITVLFSLPLQCIRFRRITLKCVPAWTLGFEKTITVVTNITIWHWTNTKQHKRQSVFWIFVLRLLKIRAFFYNNFKHFWNTMFFPSWYDDQILTRKVFYCLVKYNHCINDCFIWSGFQENICYYSFLFEVCRYIFITTGKWTCSYIYYSYVTHL